MKTKYILKRVLIAIPTFFGITVLAYIISSMAPAARWICFWPIPV